MSHPLTSLAAWLSAALVVFVVAAAAHSVTERSQTVRVAAHRPPAATAGVAAAPPAALRPAPALAAVGIPALQRAPRHHGRRASRTSRVAATPVPAPTRAVAVNAPATAAAPAPQPVAPAPPAPRPVAPAPRPSTPARGPAFDSAG